MISSPNWNDVNGSVNAPGAPDPNEVKQRRDRHRELLRGIELPKARLSSQVELDDVAQDDPDRGLFLGLVAAERRLVEARRQRDELREQQDAIIAGRDVGTPAERATRLRELRERDADTEIELADAERLLEAADHECDAARRRQHGRRVVEAQRALAEWERWRDGQLDEMRRLQREADVLHDRFLSVEGLMELARRRAAVQELMR
jgi:hypothetical protein